MMVKLFDYDTKGAPQSWAKIIALRHALTLHPEAKFIWFLDQNSYIMDLDQSLEELVLNPPKLESLMIKDHSIVPPDSIIKTFSHLKGGDASFIISQDDSGLVTNSMIIRNGEWAKFFVETWMDPLYRSYNFQKAERHALVGVLVQMQRRVADLCRNILFNGTLPFCRSSPSYLNVLWPHTDVTGRAIHTAKVTLWPSWSTVAPQALSVAKSSRSRTVSN